MSEQAMTPPEAAIEAKRLEAKREKARRLQEQLRGRLEEPKGTMPPAMFQNIMRAAVNADRKGDEESARALVEMAHERRRRGILVAPSPA
ncbi:hypothetical protein [Roseovarius sp.]|uniref:hypothetical protein n=1 Tax=Roseovarius sp. TaxID=1486281 RepID=UPI0026217C51|nr:hypothetical protein [Roseovarius sp.]